MQEQISELDLQHADMTETLHSLAEDTEANNFDLRRLQEEMETFASTFPAQPERKDKTASLEFAEARLTNLESQLENINIKLKDLLPTKTQGIKPTAPSAPYISEEPVTQT